ncbi:MAG TPA: LamG-like jellyroll fold domain-containing protein [Verrucomicrobiae bacterium]|jgi:hypothetical protein|nr:LamG-like jellyroll fold domain-containing protein [Verrucomicrobiae bacterium]
MKTAKPCLLPLTRFMTFALLCACLGALPTSASTVVGLWRFDEGAGASVSDSSGLGNNGTLQGEGGVLPTWTTGQDGFGNALMFSNDGTNHNYVDIPGSASLRIGQTSSDAWTITCWAYESSDGTSDFVAAYGRFLVLDDGTAFQFESGASGDNEVYTWARANPDWQLGWLTDGPVSPLLDQWVHWAVTYDGTNLSVYRDGNQGPSGGALVQPLVAAIGYSGYQGAIHIGTELGQDGTRNWNGMLDDVAVFAGALTQSQIQTVMSGDFSSFFGGPGDVLSQPQNQTVPQGGAATFTVGAIGKAPLQFQWYHDSSPLPGQTNATLNLANVQPAQAGNYTVSVSNSLGGNFSQPARLIVYSPATTLVGLWRFNEGSGTNALDSSGLGNDGVLRGENGNVPGYVDGQPGFGSALSFTNDGLDHSYVDIPGNASLMIGQTATNPWTITAWAYEKSDGGGDSLAGYGRILVIDDGTALQLESGAAGDEQFYTWARANTAWQIGWDGAIPLLFDQWEHWAVVYDGTNLSVYLNGDQGAGGALASMPVNAALGFAGYTGSIHIGSEVGETGDRNWYGYLDDVAVFNTALTTAQIRTVMSGNFAAFLPKPPLSIVLQGGDAVLSWPVAQADFQLQSTTNLTNPNWGGVAGTLTTNGNNVSVSVPLGSGNQFFRLLGH